MGNPGKMPERQPSAGCSDTPPFNPDANGSGSMFPGPPAMDNGSKVPMHMGVSPDAETPTINPNSSDTGGIADISAGDNSSQQCPTQHPSAPPQHDTMRCQCYSCVVKKIQTDLFLEAKTSYDAWFDLKQKTSQEINEMSKEIARLTVGSPPPISSVISNFYLI